MVKITIIAVGRLKERYLQEGVAEFSKRLRPYCKLTVREAPAQHDEENAARQKQLLESEALKIRAMIPARSTVVALTIEGYQCDSLTLASKIEKMMREGCSHFTFLIGGSRGLDETLKKEADICLSLSNCTFPHQLTRLILLEQLYRIFKIINGENYHK